MCDGGLGEQEQAGNANQREHKVPEGTGFTRHIGAVAAEKQEQAVAHARIQRQHVADKGFLRKFYAKTQAVGVYLN